MFKKFIKFIEKSSKKDFKKSCDELEKEVLKLEKNELIEIIEDIGIIPENIEHDSSQEKLYSKFSDMILSRCLIELGLKSKVLTERANSADVIAKSNFYDYSLVADAKCFRLSRTAKNQKDFKINSLNNWRGEENDYAILVSPYYQYPKKESQIYSDALIKNVCILSWEHLIILLKSEIKETENFSLEKLWKISFEISENRTINRMKENFFDEFNIKFKRFFNIKLENFDSEFYEAKRKIFDRAEIELLYWENEIKKIELYTKEEAIKELIKAKKLEQKMNTIKKYVLMLEGKK